MHARMRARSWHDRPGCPTPAELALLRLDHWDFHGQVRQGQLVVARTVAREVVFVFERIFEARFPIAQMAEVSRFCISKDFRKRQGDWLYPQSNEPESNEDERRVIPNMTLGLIEGLVQMSLDHEVLYWCAAMERPPRPRTVRM